MRITIKELVKEMKELGYKITPHGVKYYLEKGLLPKPVKIGGPKKGVRLVFADKEEVMERLFHIFKMKGKGYHLNEIYIATRNEDMLGKKIKRKKFLENFIKDEGQFFFVYKREPTELWIDWPEELSRHSDLFEKYFYGLRHSDEKHYLFNYGLRHSDEEHYLFNNEMKEVLSRGLYTISHVYHEKKIIPDSGVKEIIYWTQLHANHETFSWDILEKLHDKNTDNYDKYFFWPNPDGMKFTDNYIGHRRQLELNRFGSYLLEYIESTIDKTLVYSMSERLEEALIFTWHYKYDSTDALVQDFLDGKCAFVPTSDKDSRYFLKKF